MKTKVIAVANQKGGSHAQSWRGIHEYRDAMNACRVAYDHHLLVVDPDNFYGLRDDESPFRGADLAALMARQEEIHALANDDPEFADLLDQYETLSRDITTCKLIGQLDDRTCEKKRYEELELQHIIDAQLRRTKEC